jgi:hypothetical protein
MPNDAADHRRKAFSVSGPPCSRQRHHSKSGGVGRLWSKDQGTKPLEASAQRRTNETESGRRRKPVSVRRGRG